MDKSAKKFLIGAVLYILIALATGNWHYERYPRTNLPLTPGKMPGAAAVFAGITWPFYWTYKIIDTIVCPEPVEQVED